MIKVIRTIAFIAMGTALQAYAHDFTVTQGEEILYFEITDSVKRKASVTYSEEDGKRAGSQVSGVIKIPSKVRHDDKIYVIDGIGRKAFAGAENLKTVELPSTVKSIGDFAFEDCTSLEKVILSPGGEGVEMGEGVFFRCPSLKFPEPIISTSSRDSLRYSLRSQIVDLEIEIDCLDHQRRQNQLHASDLLENFPRMSHSAETELDENADSVDVTGDGEAMGDPSATFPTESQLEEIESTVSRLLKSKNRENGNSNSPNKNGKKTP